MPGPSPTDGALGPVRAAACSETKSIPTSLSSKASPEVSYYHLRLTVNRGHQLYLVIAFRYVLLVSTNGIYPQRLLLILPPQPL